MFHKYNEYCYSRKIFIDFYDTNIKYIVSLPDNLKQIKMKKLIYLLLLIAACSCSSKDEPKAFKIDSNAMISIKPSVGAWKAPSFIKTNGTTHLSALEIVKQANNLSYYSPTMTASLDERVNIMFDYENAKDTINCKFNLPGTIIIDQDGNYRSWFTKAKWILLRKIYSVDGVKKIDTLAYVPNAVIKAAYFATVSAYDTGKIDEVYSLFNEAYVFLPITGYEWLKLKSDGTEL